MIITIRPDSYINIDNIDKKTTTGINFFDHMQGFDKNLTNPLLDKIRDCNLTVSTEFLFDSTVKLQYPTLKLYYNHDMWIRGNKIESLKNYRRHTKLDYKNLVCSFNNSPHVGRQLLTSVLNNQGLFNSEYCSKNFIINNDITTGNLSYLDLSIDEIELYDKFFKNSEEFNQQIVCFGEVPSHDILNNTTNLYMLENKLTQSFLNLVSETMATSYYPFVTEKFLHSVVTRGLFLAYAQPGWHSHIEKYYGFKLYKKIFNYDFDSIANPVKRLIKLIEMVSKFKSLSMDDLMDLHLLELDNIEYNYNHFFSNDYAKHVKQFDKTGDL